MATPPAPLYRDPTFDGPADPTVVKNAETGRWFMFYTQRRANRPAKGAAWAHGTDIGFAVSLDGADWQYKGTVNLEYGEGRNTFWAPEIIRENGMWHMYVSFVEGIPTDWTAPAQLLHFTSLDLDTWVFQSVMDFGHDRCSEASVAQLPDGTWRMWYRNEAGAIYAADSPDLYEWKCAGVAISGRVQSSPHVFEISGIYWMLTDSSSGQLVYRSTDLTEWHRQPMPLLSVPGRRSFDEALGHGAMVLPQGPDSGFLYYFTQPGGGIRSVIQVARVYVRDGWLRCDRDAPFKYMLTAANTAGVRGGSAKDVARAA